MSAVHSNHSNSTQTRHHLVERFRQQAQRQLDAAESALANGDPAAGLEIAERLARRAASAIDSAAMASSDGVIYHDIEDRVDAMIWLTSNHIKQTLQRMPLPLSRIHALRGRCLSELGRHQEALMSFSQAIRWNPASAVLALEAANEALAAERLETCRMLLDHAYPCIWRPEDLMAWHFACSRLLIAQGKTELGAQHAIVARKFDAHIAPKTNALLAELRDGSGMDFTQLTQREAACALLEAGEPLFAHASVLEYLPRIIDVIADAGDFDIAATATYRLAGLTGDYSLAARISAYQHGMRYIPRCA